MDLDNLSVQNNFYFLLPALQNWIVDKLNRILKANGGKKKPVKSKQRKDIVYYGSRKKVRSWEAYGDRTSEGWLDWEERGWGWVLSLNKYIKTFRFTEGAERSKSPDEREILLFKTRFFESDHYKTLCSWLSDFDKIAKSAAKAGLYKAPNDEPIKLKATKDHTQNYANIAGMLSSLRLFAASQTFLVLKFSDLYHTHIAGIDMSKLWVCQKFGFAEDVSAKETQKALDWFYEHESYFEEIIRNLDWLVDEIGVVSAEATAFGYGDMVKPPKGAPTNSDTRKYQIEKFREYIDDGITIPFYTDRYYKDGSVRVFSIAFATYLLEEAAPPLTAKTKALGADKELQIEVSELMNKYLPDAKRLLNNVHISKWKDMLEFSKGYFDSVSYNAHLKNFQDYDELAGKILWVEDYIYTVGFWESPVVDQCADQRSSKLGEFLELIERVKSWAVYENEGALAQLQTMFFKLKEAKSKPSVSIPNDIEVTKGGGRVKTATVNLKIYGNSDEQSLLERLTNLIETVSDTYAGCSLGDVMVVWVGDYQRRSDRKKPSPPSADKLRREMTDKEESPYAKLKNSWSRQTLLHPAWQTFVKLWPANAIKALKANVKEEGAKGLGRRIEYFQHHGKIAIYAKSKKVAEFLINHFGDEYIQSIVENRETRLAAKSAQKKSAS